MTVGTWLGGIAGLLVVLDLLGVEVGGWIGDLWDAARRGIRRGVVPRVSAMRTSPKSRETLGAGDDLRLLDTTPLPCGQSVQTTRTSELAPWAGFGYCPAHSRRYWGFKLVLLCAPDGTIVDFDRVAANAPEREWALPIPVLFATSGRRDKVRDAFGRL